MKYVVGILAALLLMGGGFFAFQQMSKEEVSESLQETTETTFSGVEHRVELTPDGYEPSEITIGVGDKITFSASGDYERLHWPASNIHPSHDIYPEFDPLAPIEPEASWSFVFGKIGEWRFHDHLAPYHTGVITVE